MVCIYCQHDTRVINSRPQKRSNRIWRRRRCEHCKQVVTTVEELDYTASTSMKDAYGRLRPFQRDILFVSVLDSLRHRQTAVADATSLTDTLLTRLPSCMDTAGAIDRTKLVALVGQTLQRFDHVAAVHYQAFHPVKPN